MFRNRVKALAIGDPEPYKESTCKFHLSETFKEGLSLLGNGSFSTRYPVRGYNVDERWFLRVKRFQSRWLGSGGNQKTGLIP
jgi:hypothetical protein